MFYQETSLPLLPLLALCDNIYMYKYSERGFSQEFLHKMYFILINTCFLNKPAITDCSKNVLTGVIRSAPVLEVFDGKHRQTVIDIANHGVVGTVRIQVNQLRNKLGGPANDETLH